MNDSKSSHLSVVVDLSPSQWYQSGLGPPTNTYPLTFSAFISQFLAFINTHIASKNENTLAVFGALPGKSVLLYSSSEAQKESKNVDANSYPPFKQVDTVILNRIDEHLSALNHLEEDEPPALVGALAKALCHVNRITQPSVPLAQTIPLTDASNVPDPRILILSVSPDLSSSYISIMNCIFSAQKLRVIVDVCQVYGRDAVFLQQASHLTGGSYISPERRDSLLQYLIMAFLPPPEIRKILAVPTQHKIDFRAACFCHKNIVDIGFVCSVCLSIYCQPVPVCSTCRTKFPIKTLQRLNASRTATLSANPSPRSTPASTPLPRMPSRGDLNHVPARSRPAASIELPNSNSIGTSPSRPTTNGSKH